MRKMTSIKTLVNETFRFLPDDKVITARDIILTSEDGKDCILPKGTKLKIDFCFISNTPASTMTYKASMPIESKAQWKELFSPKYDVDLLAFLIQETEFNDCDFEVPKGRQLLRITDHNNTIYIEPDNI